MNFYKKCKKAFTMAESLMILALIGTIAAMTIPSLISHHKQIAAKTKIRKAITEYDSLLRRAQVDNYLTIKTNDDLYALIHNDDCEIIVDYMTILEKDGCKFNTPDGIWWQLFENDDNVLWAVAAANENDLDTIVNANNKNTAYKTGAWLYAYYKDGVLNVNNTNALTDLRKDKGNQIWAQARNANTKLKNFID